MPMEIARAGEVARQPEQQQPAVQAEVHHPPAVEMEETFPVTERAPQHVGVRDEIYYPMVEMQETYPAMEQAPGEMEVHDEVNYPEDSVNVEMEEHQPAITHEKSRVPRLLHAPEPALEIETEERQGALTYESMEENLEPLPISQEPRELEDEILTAPEEPYQINLPESSSSDSEDERPRAIKWAGHPEAGGTRLRPRPVIHPKDREWLNKKRPVPSDSSEERRRVKVSKKNSDNKPPGVQSLSESYQERQEAEALSNEEDLMREVRRLRKPNRQGLGEVFTCSLSRLKGGFKSWF
jgi:hypothetical protein